MSAALTPEALAELERLERESMATAPHVEGHQECPGCAQEYRSSEARQQLRELVGGYASELIATARRAQRIHEVLQKGLKTSDCIDIEFASRGHAIREAIAILRCSCNAELHVEVCPSLSSERLTGPSDDTPVSSDDILRAGESPPFIQVGMVLRPMGAAGATIPSAGDGDFNDGPRTVVAVEKQFGEPAYAKLIPGYQNSATLQERCDWLRKYWVLANDFDPAAEAEALHLASDLP